MRQGIDVFWWFSPLEEEKVDIIIAFGQEVAKYTRRVATADLVGW